MPLPGPTLSPLGVSRRRRSSGGAGYAAAVMADSPVVYWRLGESSGTAAADSSGNGNAGVYSSGLTMGVSGITGGDGAVGFRAGSQSPQVSLAAGAGLPTGAGSPFAVEFWHRTYAYVSLSQYFGFGIVLPAGGAADGTNRNTLSFNGHYYFWGVNSGDWDSGVAWDSDSAWHHIVWASDGTTLTLYRDGVSAASIARPAGLATASPAITAGSCHISAASCPNADVDECAIYAGLSATRVSAHYAAGI